MPCFNIPDGTVVVIPQIQHAWVAIVRDELGSLAVATNAEDLMEEEAVFLRSFGPTDLDGGKIRVRPPELAAKAVFPEANSRPF